MNPKKTFQNTMFGIMAAVTAWSLAGIARFAASTSPQVADPGVCFFSFPYSNMLMMF
jgi:hypothetical protein